MKTIKRCFIDTETSGLSGEINGLHQIAGIIDINGEPVEEFNLHARPFEEDFITQDALKACNVTREQIMSYEDPLSVHKKFTDILSNYVNRFKKHDKFFFIAYNSNFDNDHIRAFFKKCGDKYYGSFFWVPDICVMRKAGEFLINERVNLENFQQKTVAEYLNLVDREVEWHEALSDVKIARDIYYYIDKKKEDK